LSFHQCHPDGGLADSLCERVVAHLEVPGCLLSEPLSGRSPIAVGKFDNRSSYMRGIFSDGVDRLGSQAKTMLITHLQQTGRFSVLDRDNMAEIRAEAGIKQQAQQLKGADYVVTGDVTEFGRKEVGDHQLFGIWVVASHRSPMPRST
jgi:curli biogenesis system outer membrane secretion channel CsgG